MNAGMTDETASSHWNLSSRHLHSVILIAGPTASGKSALALELAAALGGTIINADALQVYRDLRILSARPDAAAAARAPHRLYGYLDAAERGSVGQWRALALGEIAAVQSEGRLPILVGGTGLYLHAVQHGLAAIPPIPPAIRAEAAALYRAEGGARFRDRLAALDPDAAARLPPGDRQRLLRAFEVVRATGRPLRDWQQGGAAASSDRYCSLLLLPQRGLLYAVCDARFAAMVAHGGIEEAAALLARNLDPDLPAMKAVGVPELFAHLRGETAHAAAVAAGQRATRHYVKRQMTWFRHQMTADRVFAAPFSAETLRDARDFIDRWRLTRARSLT
jgi:tRNA dimethylallyltransferase